VAPPAASARDIVRTPSLRCVAAEPSRTPRLRASHSTRLVTDAPSLLGPHQLAPRHPIACRAAPSPTDPHPGNLIRTVDGKICVLDFGLMTEVTPEQRVALVEYIAHLTTQVRA
jgi:hypothetical protein